MTQKSGISYACKQKDGIKYEMYVSISCEKYVSQEQKLEMTLSVVKRVNRFHRQHHNYQCHTYKVLETGFFFLYCYVWKILLRIIVLYENIDQTLPNKLHGPMHYKIGDICVYNGHVFYTLL